MTVEINTVEVVVSNEINHVDIIVDVVVNPNVGGGGGGTEITQDIMNLIYAGL